MRVDIIIPVWNNATLTKNCLDSIFLNTKDTDYKVIVVNDGSSDNTEPMVREYHTVELINKPHSGFVQSVNAGLKASKSEFVVLLNNDTIIEDPHWLKKMMDYFDDEKVGAVGATSNFVSGAQDVICNYGHKSEHTGYLISFCVMLKADRFKRIGFYLDEQFGNLGSDDIDLSIRLQEEGYELIIARDVFVRHIGTQSFKQIPNYDSESYWKAGNSLLFQKWGKEKVLQYCSERKLLIISIPNGTGLFDNPFFVNFFNCRKPTRTGMRSVQRGVVHLARNRLVQEFLKTKAEYMLFLDDDMILNEDTIKVLMSHNKDIVSAMSFRRCEPYDPCAYVFNPKDKLYSSIKPKQGLVEVDATGMACTLIKRDVFLRMKDPWFYWGNYGEDLGFCRDAKELYGYKIWCDTNLCTGHIGEKIVVNDKVFEKFFNYQQQAAEEAKKKETK